MRTALRGSLGAIFCLGASLGCLSAQGSRYDYFIEPGMEGSPAAKRWLIAPVSALDVLPDFLVAPAGRIQGEIRGHLEASGRSVEAASQSLVFELAPKLPQVELADVDLVPDGRLAALTRKLAQSSEFDVAAYPELVVHNVSVPQGRTGVWHGVRRRVRVVKEKDAPEGLYSMSQTQPAVSLRMRVFGRDGAKHFESFGGLEFLQEARVSGWRFYMEIRPDLLSDRAVLREGVEIALAPYVPESAAGNR